MDRRQTADTTSNSLATRYWTGLLSHLGLGGLKGHIKIFNMVTGELLAEKDNLITNTGMRIIMRQLETGKGFTLSEGMVWVTDNTTTPAVTDTTSEFAQRPGNKLFPAKILDTYVSGTTIYFVCTMFLNDANFQWKKLGLIDKYGRLFSEVAFDYSSKTSDVQLQLQWSICALQS